MRDTVIVAIVAVLVVGLLLLAPWIVKIFGLAAAYLFFMFWFRKNWRWAGGILLLIAGLAVVVFSVREIAERRQRDRREQSYFKDEMSKLQKDTAVYTSGSRDGELQQQYESNLSYDSYSGVCDLFRRWRERKDKAEQQARKVDANNYSLFNDLVSQKNLQWAALDEAKANAHGAAYARAYARQAVQFLGVQDFGWIYKYAYSIPEGFGLKKEGGNPATDEAFKQLERLGITSDHLSRFQGHVHKRDQYAPKIRIDNP